MCPQSKQFNAIRVHFRSVEPAFVVDGVYSVNRAGQVRVDVFVEGVRVFSEGYSGAGAWQLDQDSEIAEPASAAGAAALIQSSDRQLRGLHELRDRGYILGYEGVESVDSVEYHVVSVRSADGHVVRRYLNAESLLIERSRETKALHPDVDPMEVVIETRFSDFREVDGGVVKPFLEVQVDLESGDVLATTTVESVEVNPELSPARFEPPGPNGAESVAGGEEGV